jgi:4-carboxymuconolactone decarboxylase
MRWPLVTDHDSYELGMRRRRQVLGDEYVDANLAGADDLTRTFQDLVTVQVWGRAWAGDALDDRTRALVTLGMLAALGRFDEVEIYARAAIRCGASVDDIRDVLVHVTAYCGAPAGRQAFAAASRGLRSVGPGGTAHE